MWSFLVRFILRNRLTNLIVILLLTGFMGYMASRVQLSYEFNSMLPASDSTRVIYDRFLKQFGQDGSVMFIGIKDKDLFKLEKFNDLN